MILPTSSTLSKKRRVILHQLQLVNDTHTVYTIYACVVRLSPLWGPIILRSSQTEEGGFIWNVRGGIGFVHMRISVPCGAIPLPICRCQDNFILDFCFLIGFAFSLLLEELYIYIYIYYPPWNWHTSSHWKSMVGRWNFFWAQPIWRGICCWFQEMYETEPTYMSTWRIRRSFPTPMRSISPRNAKRRWGLSLLAGIHRSLDVELWDMGYYLRVAKFPVSLALLVHYTKGLR